MGLVDKLRAKYELYRLEQRYTRREKRTTFYSDAQYVDGEYVHNTLASSSPLSHKSFGSFGSKRTMSVRVTELSSSSPSSYQPGKRQSRLFNAPPTTRINSGWRV